MMMTSNHIPYTGAAIIHSVDNEYDDGLPMNMKYDLTGVCNGLICLRAETLKDGFYLTWVRFWNPDTRVLNAVAECVTYNHHPDFFRSFCLGVVFPLSMSENGDLVFLGSKCKPGIGFVHTMKKRHLFQARF
ncbi:hypothetical protein D0Y65_012718 [Glycine soja]|uniref:Uncharacterized protein n=1 Tax=Glycine soja TaxID=3848 RepID=A0A445KQD4_GLYSO|nr:hypothetical protein D0Y65_012718 [Glycine soja]